MPRLKTIRAFERWSQDEANVEDLLRRVAGGTKLQKACLEVKQPYTCVYPFLHSTPELKARYEAALSAVAEGLVQDALEIAHDPKRKIEQAAVADRKLRIETNQRTATWWNRERYGERLDVHRTIEASADDALLGTVGELLRLAEQRRLPEKVVAEVPQDKPEDE
jgi:hypothetical protein